MPDSAAVLLAELPDQWKVTLPTGTKKAGAADEYAGTQLVTQYGKTPWFGPGPAGSGIAFRAPVDGVTTGGSEFPRSELREMNPDGSPASWGSDDGDTHILTVIEAVTRIPNKRTKGTAATVSAQIHGVKDDVSVFRCEGTSIWVTQGNTTHFALADSAYVPGTPYEAKYVVAGGVVSAYYNGRLVVAFKADFAGAYFKAGAYTQANTSNSQPGDATNYGETIIYDLRVQHGAPLPGQVPPVVVPPANPGPPAPAPDPTVQGPVVIVVRHANKPAGSMKGYGPPNGTGPEDSHSLTKDGWKRTAGIAEMFAPTNGLIRPDLDIPTQIITADGPEAGERMKQTGAALAARLGLTLNLGFDKSDTSKLGAYLKTLEPGAVTLVIWEHSEAPKIWGAMGTVTPKAPTSWPDENYNAVEIFEGDGKGGWKWRETAELILPTDKAIGLSGKALTIPVLPVPPVVVPVPPIVVPPVITPPPVVVDPPPPVIPTPPPVEPPIVSEPPVIPLPPIPAPVPASQPPGPAPQPDTRSLWQKFVDFINRIFQGM